MGVIYPRRVRECAKLGCRATAAATVGMRYRERILWVGDVLPQRDPNLIDLCASHADSMAPPYGWSRLDDRQRTAIELHPDTVAS